MTDDRAWKRSRLLRWKWNYGPVFDTEEAAKEYYCLDYPAERRAGHFVSICKRGDGWQLVEYVYHDGSGGNPYKVEIVSGYHPDR